MTAEHDQAAEAILAPFREHLHARRCAKSTIDTFARGVRAFITWHITERRSVPQMQSISRLDMADYHEHVRSSPTAAGKLPKPATIDKAMAALKAYYAYLCEVDEAVRNPMVHIKAERKGAPRAPQALSDKELGKLLEGARDRITLADEKRRPIDKTATACEARRDFAIVNVLAYAGLRVGELCSLTLDDVTIQARGGELVVRRGKGNKRREAELNLSCRKALIEWMTWRNYYCDDKKCAALFVSRKGGAIKPRAVERAIDSIAKQATARGLKSEVTPHTLRHTFARRLLDGGTALKDVQEHMGHESIATTAKYLRPSREKRKQDVERIDLRL